MGRLTPEKVASVISSFDKTKSYSETGKIESLDWKTVKYHVTRNRKDYQQPTQHKPSANTAVEAYKLFESGKRIVEVAIAPGIPGPEVMKYEAEYLAMKEMDLLNQLHDELGSGVNNLGALYRYMKEKNMHPITYVQYLREPYLLEKAHSELPVVEQKLQRANARLDAANKDLQVVPKRYKEFRRLRSEIYRLEAKELKIQLLISTDEKSPAFAKVRTAAEEHAKKFLSDNGRLVRAAVIAALSAVEKRDISMDFNQYDVSHIIAVANNLFAMQSKVIAVETMNTLANE